MKKKVLIITYYWPPAGGPGVQRWLKFVKYLDEFDVEPVVYAPENPHYPIVDKSFEKEVPKDITVLKRPIFEPYALASLFSGKKTKQISSGLISEQKQSFAERALLWIRGNFFIPDARKFWVKPSVRYLSGYLRRENIDTVITTGPPHSVHLIGMKLKERTGIRWIADFRDPWTNISYHEKLKLSRLSQKKHRKLEQKVLNTADRLIVTSYITAEEFRAKTSKLVEVITNGYDPMFVEKTEPDETFTIAHIGSLLTERNPEALWEALAELVREHKDFADSLILKFAGTVSGEVLQSLEKHGLDKYMKLLGYLPHEEALKLQRSSRILLLLEMDKPETRGIIPGKLFEYMAAKRPVIAIGPEGWDVAKIIAETGCGTTFTYPEKEAIKNKLYQSYERYLWNKLKVSPTGIQKYSRKSLAGKLAAIIKEEEK
ncbi:glycosyltransferase family 4 protein [Sinomicrobium sp. FJxs]|uniref:Glycosyltransferase family 4 protein n=1 Tax=Sinomicrobium weinanense TaxID=2842200 RepID=A0A926JQW7_9FLAO|nr:glycosyltransferase family 4 protein [Sinomicrobium weinanense]MBC9795642.1 glycosyltransferase family 4 protein [Sinomicrobium weinanense]MBU3122811.1 glycosyltransferase family 4 protein [Sinomicrobium weinanense]